MAKYNLNNYTDKDGLGFPLNFRRGNPNPLDNSSVWGSLEDAQNYAATDPVAYVGQILTVVEVLEDGKTAATVYSIQDESGTLEEISAKADLSRVIPRYTTISISSDAWIGDVSPFSQVVTVNSVTENSKVDLQPSAAQLKVLQDAEVSLMAENNGGVIRIWAIGDKLNEDMTMQITITEVVTV